jgi:hypothetical protein
LDGAQVASADGGTMDIIAYAIAIFFLQRHLKTAAQHCRVNARFVATEYRKVGCALAEAWRQRNYHRTAGE